MPTSSQPATGVWLGDKWQFDVIFNDQAGDPIIVDTTDNIPGAALFVGTQKQGIPLVYGQNVDVGNGTLLPTVQIIDGQLGRVRFTVHAVMYAGVKFVPSNDSQTVFNHIQFFLLDHNGERQTQIVVDLDVEDPRTTDDNTLGSSSTVVAITGPQGRPGTGATQYIFTTQSPLVTWPLHHNLGFYPNIVLVDTANDVFYANITYVDANNAVVYMNAPTTGSAYCS